MTTTNLVAPQLGNFDTATGIWSPAVGNLVNLTAGVEAWAQVEKTIPLVSAIEGFTVRLTTAWAETANLSILVYGLPVTANFATANPPTPSTIVTTAEVDVIAGVNTITLPLSVNGSAASLLHSQMRARWRAHSSGLHRFAVGLAWDGTGGITGVSTWALTYVDQFTGWGNRRGQAGTNKAVECPRCGQKWDEKSMVRDGLLRLDVCPDCYDTPEEAPNFHWPFRS